MTAEQLEHLKQVILKKREELLAELELLKAPGATQNDSESSADPDAYTFHMADLGTDTMEKEKQYFFASREGNFLYHLNQALERIERGEYGICVGCNQEISLERLEAVPHARLCINCKSKEESAKR